MQTSATINRPARMLITLVPAGLEKMFFEAGVPMAEGVTIAAPPTHEEIERTMQFILNQQAKFSVDIDLLKESQERFSDNQTRMSADIENLKISVAGLLELSRHSMETADADRRMVREMVQDLKDTIYRVESKADKALILATRDSEEKHDSEQS